MRGVTCALAALLAASALAQEATDYTAADNPFQAEYTFVSGQPIVLRIDIQGVLVDSIILTAPSPLPSGQTASCTAEVLGSNDSGRKAAITAVMLLEDADGKSLEKLSMDPFKVKPRRTYNERQSLDVGTAALASAARVYVFIKID